MKKDALISQLSVQNDSRYSDVYSKYKDEVDAVAKTLPASVDKYQLAVKKVQEATTMIS